MDAFALPSYYEGCSVALLEMLAGGLFTLAHDVGNAAEVIRPGANGEIVPREVRFPYEEPGHVGELRSFFRCPLQFQAPYVAIVLKRDDLDLPVWAGVLPCSMTWGAPVDAADLLPGRAVSPSVLARPARVEGSNRHS